MRGKKGKKKCNFSLYQWVVCQVVLVFLSLLYIYIYTYKLLDGYFSGVCNMCMLLLSRSARQHVSRISLGMQLYANVGVPPTTTERMHLKKKHTTPSQNFLKKVSAKTGYPITTTNYYSYYNYYKNNAKEKKKVINRHSTRAKKKKKASPLQTSPALEAGEPGSKHTQDTNCICTERPIPHTSFFFFFSSPYPKRQRAGSFRKTNVAWSVTDRHVKCHETSAKCFLFVNK